ncbi:MAG: hypothetical protein ACMXYC_02685, partial [Candidatus Woesearchaeota archaeon]
FTVETPRTMQCAYDTVNKPFDQMIPFTWSDGFTHSGMAQLYENPIDYFVKCKEANTVINEPNPAVFTLKYDTSKPRISGISLSPGIQNKVVERPLQTTLSLDTDIDARCEYMLNNVTHAFDTGFTKKHTVFIENLQDKTTYDLSISCYSRALVKSDISRYSIIVDTAQRGDITFSSPQAFVSNKTFTLALQTQQDTQWCRWSFSQSQINNDMQRVSARQYSENITVQQDGTYTIYVSCVGSDARILRGQKTVNVYTQPVTCEDVTVVVPQTSPFRDRIPVEVYTNKTLQHIQAIVGTARYPQAGWNMSDIQNISNYESFSITGLNLSLEQTYYVNYRLQAATLSEWCVSNGTKVMTNASIPSSPTSIVSIVMEKTRYTSQDTIRALVNFSSTQALSVPYHYYINNKRHEGRTLNLSGTVQEQIELGTLQEGNYELKIVLGQHERIQNFRVDCTSGIDCFCDRNNCEDNQSIIPGTCTDGIKNGLETDVDCGGPDCLGCELTKQCQIHSDCRSGNCQAGICVAQTRTPDIQEESSSLLWMLLILLLIVLALAGGGLYYYTQIYQKKTQIKSSSSKSSTTLPPLGSTNKQAPAPIAPPKSAKQKLKEALQKKLKAHVDDKVKQDHSKVFSAFSEDKDKPQKDIKDNNKNIDNNDKIKNKTIDDKINDAKTQIIHKKEDRNVVDPKSKKEESMSDMDKLKSINTGSNIDAIRSIIQKNKKAKDSLEKLKALNTGKKDE